MLHNYQHPHLSTSISTFKNGVTDDEMQRLTIQRHPLELAKRRMHDIRQHNPRVQRHGIDIFMLCRDVIAEFVGGEPRDGVGGEPGLRGEDGEGGGDGDDCWVERGCVAGEETEEVLG